MQKHKPIELTQEQMIALIEKKKGVNLSSVTELAKTYKPSERVKKQKPIKVEEQNKFRCQISLPFPPSINRYYGRGFRGNVYIKTAGKEFREKARIILEVAGLSNINTKEKIKAVLVFHPPDKRKRDWDNIQKAVWDSLKKHVYEDDSQIDVILVARGKSDKNNPRVDIVIETRKGVYTDIDQADRLLAFM